MAYPPTRQVLEQTGEREQMNLDEACRYFNQYDRHEARCYDCGGAVCQYVDTGKLGLHEGCPTESAFCDKCGMPLDRDNGLVDESQVITED